MGNLCGRKSPAKVRPERDTREGAADAFDPVAPDKNTAVSPSSRKGDMILKNDPPLVARHASKELVERERLEARAASKKRHLDEDKEGIRFRDRRSLNEYRAANPHTQRPLILTYDYEEVTRALVSAYEFGKLDEVLARIALARKESCETTPVDVVMKTRSTLEACYWRVLNKSVQDNPG